MAVGAVVLGAAGAFGVVPWVAGGRDVELAGHRVGWLVPVLGLGLVAAALAYVLGVAAVQRLGARLAFGTDVDTIYHFRRAELVVSLDADFLSCGPGSVRYTREFARRRRPEGGPLLRFYAVQTSASATGALADYRLALRPSD